MTSFVPRDESDINSFRYKNKIVLITGATKGIGFAIAKRFGYEGATVIITSRRQTNVDAALAKLRKLGFPCDGRACHAGDFSKFDALIKFVVDKYGRIDVLIPQAGINPTGRDVWKVTPAQIKKMFDVNLFGIYYLIKAAHKFMPRGSSIVVHGSTGGYSPPPMIGLYCVSKTALFGLTQMLAREITPKHGIRINCVASGPIKTEFMKNLMASLEKRKDIQLYPGMGEVLKGASILKKMQMAALMQRLGEPYEIAAVFAFLASSDASYMSGQTLVTSGGSRFSRL